MSTIQLTMDFSAAEAVVVDHKAANQCRKAADALQNKIDQKHTSARNMRSLPPTRKRRDDSEGIFNDAVRLEKYQRVLRQLADAHETGTIATELSHVTSFAAVERETYRIPTLRAMFDACERAETPAERNQRMERQFMLAGIPGFFATPQTVADEVTALLGPIPSDAVLLEPGAGTGALIDAALRVQPLLKVHYFERNYSLNQFLETKYGGNTSIYQPSSDFTDVEPLLLADQYAPRYDFVLMNPPFENGQDAEHIQLAYRLLKPNGILASIVGEGVFFRNDKKAIGFREFLEANNGRDWKLPESSFKASGTGTSCRMIQVRA